jgi:LacI family transcriptional regulator
MRVRVTIKDIAKVAGVSVGTASMALNDKPGINKETRQKVLEVAERMYYRPNYSARSLITKKSGAIGLVVTDIRNPFFSKLVDVFNREVEQRGYSLLLGISSDKVSLEKKCVDLFVGRNVEGIIIVPTIQTSPDLEHLYMLKRMKIPFVFCTTAYNGIETDVVMTDLMEGEYQIVSHLIGKGRRSIFFVTCDRNLLLSKQRLEGYKKAHLENDLTYSNEQIIETEPDYEHGYEVGKALAGSKADAVVTVNDFLAFGVSKAFKDAGVRIPKDIAVAGYDDLLFSNLVEPPLTTVKQPITEICSKTLEVLFDRIENGSGIARVHSLNPKLIIRDSTVVQ